MSDHEKNISEKIENNTGNANMADLSENMKDQLEEVDDLVHVGDLSDDGLPVIPLRGLAIFPTMLLHFDVGREKSVSALENAMMTGQPVFLVTQKNSETDLPTREDLYEIGTVANIKQMLRLPGNSIRVLAEGTSRGK